MFSWPSPIYQETGSNFYVSIKAALDLLTIAMFTHFLWSFSVNRKKLTEPETVEHLHHE